jgi:hypothetical protein
VLTEGGEATPLSIDPVDMEIMAMRQFEREDICHAMGVPPVLIGDNNKTSSWGTGIEQITLGFVKYTVKPHLRRWEEEMNRKLYRNAGPFLEFDLSALLKGDSKAQAEDDRAALGGPGTGDGYKTVNEIRRSRNLPPIAGGDELFKATAKPAASAAPAEGNHESQQADAAPAGERARRRPARDPQEVTDDEANVYVDDVIDSYWGAGAELWCEAFGSGRATSRASAHQQPRRRRVRRPRHGSRDRRARRQGDRAHRRRGASAATYLAAGREAKCG